MDGHLLKLKCKYSNILTFISWKLYQIKTKTFEVFYFTCNESKIYESFTFEMLQEKKNEPYSNFLRSTCIFTSKYVWLDTVIMTWVWVCVGGGGDKTQTSSTAFNAHSLLKLLKQYHLQTETLIATKRNI